MSNINRALMSTTAINCPTEDEIRAALVARAKRYSELTGASLASIGIAAVNDGAFIQDVEKGLNFTIKRYARLNDFLDENWPKPDSARRPRARKSA